MTPGARDPIFRVTQHLLNHHLFFGFFIYCSHVLLKVSITTKMFSKEIRKFTKKQG